jgi:membrane peptidoglycan carboxypeptidase
MATRTTALAAALAIVTSIVAAAWFSSPGTSDFNRRARTAAGSGSIALSSISPLVRQAVVATEDERFYRHHGFGFLEEIHGSSREGCARPTN